ncbi:ABC transporter permease [Solirubrobacter sp. CPCC 204708]|uniref:ABC transporter permease n=1 Tax=Solirubrobacter deserti TaxID=2282478 RepID=A0ABT4RRI6_9ACTN|nr:ABC transporter permease [Solirubrobacter deserti]MBE2314793.1 ABC transporter permease [Solirubrobacter deserti]MDA0141203.1 ABC transporter permease [Solirubrobacter deserti]
MINRNVRLVARREITERAGEKSFLISTGITLAIIVLVVVIPPLLGLGGTSEYVIATDAQSRPVAERAVALAGNFDAEVTISDTEPDVRLVGGEIRSEEEPDDTLVGLLQTANQALEPSRRPDLRVVTAEPVDPDRDAKAGLAFFAILMLYGQLIAYGFYVASGVVEEKSSRVVEVLLAAIRPKDLLAGKVIGLGLLGLGQLLLIAVIGVAVAGVTGALDIDGALLTAVALALVWFVLGYAFYASLYAAAGALVPRQEELQSSTTPLTMAILVSFFAGFAVNDDPDGVVAHICAFIPFTAPITMPGRIALGEVPAWEIAASVGVMIAATALLIPLAARIYSAVVLRTGSAVKLSEALRLARQ